MNEEERQHAEWLAGTYSLPIEAMGTRATIRNCLEAEVKAGRMEPSRALHIWCEEFEESETTLMWIAEKYAGFDDYEAALEALDSALDADDLPAVLDRLEGN